MLTRIEATKRHRVRYDWLDSFYLFSFANYFDPQNLQFGVLRVFNDDTIAGYSGFDEHGHENMEIVTIMLEGRLTHRDSMGNMKLIQAGEVQYMSAGTGVVHAEKNLHADPVHLYQLWFVPEREGLAPSYGQIDASQIEKNQLVPVVSSRDLPGALRMAADATVFLARMESGQRLEYVIAPTRGVFLYIQEGRLMVNGQACSMGDQVRISNEEIVILEALEDASLVFIDVLTV